VSYRAIVSNFDAAFRVVAANLAISVIPVEVGRPYSQMLGVKLIPLNDKWAHRSFAVCYRDIDALQSYWSVCPKLRKALFRANRPGYVDLAVPKEAIKSAIYEHPEFVAFMECMTDLFADWRQGSAATLKALQPGCHPKAIIKDLAENLLAHYGGKPLIDAYDVYQHLQDYWAETMQDDCYLIAVEGWKAETTRVLVKNQKGAEVDRGWTCDLIPKPLLVARYFAAERQAFEALEADLEGIAARLAEMEEEHGGEEGLFSELEKVTRATVTARLKEVKGDLLALEEAEALGDWLKLSNQEAELKRALKDAEAALDAMAYAKYPALAEAEIKALVVDDKWLAVLGAAVHGEMDRISQGLTRRVKELAERYETSLPQVAARVDDLERAVHAHLERMGFAWS